MPLVCGRDLATVPARDGCGVGRCRHGSRRRRGAIRDLHEAQSVDAAGVQEGGAARCGVGGRSGARADGLGHGPGDAQLRLRRGRKQFAAGRSAPARDRGAEQRLGRRHGGERDGNGDATAGRSVHARGEARRLVRRRRRRARSGDCRRHRVAGTGGGDPVRREDRGRRHGHRSDRRGP
jgi:hypothetical protein